MNAKEERTSASLKYLKYGILGTIYKWRKMDFREGKNGLKYPTNLSKYPRSEHLWCMLLDLKLLPCSVYGCFWRKEKWCCSSSFEALSLQYAKTNNFLGLECQMWAPSTIYHQAKELAFGLLAVILKCLVINALGTIQME